MTSKTNAYNLKDYNESSFLFQGALSKLLDNGSDGNRCTIMNQHPHSMKLKTILFGQEHYPLKPSSMEVVPSYYFKRGLHKI